MPPAALGRPLRLSLSAAGAVILLRLITALAPAEPMVLGVPAGLWFELGVVAASTAALAFACRQLLSRESREEEPEAAAADPRAVDSGRGSRP